MSVSSLQKIQNLLIKLEAYNVVDTDASLQINRENTDGTVESIILKKEAYRSYLKVKHIGLAGAMAQSIKESTIDTFSEKLQEVRVFLQQRQVTVKKTDKGHALNLLRNLNYSFSLLTGLASKEFSQSKFLTYLYDPI